MRRMLRHLPRLPDVRRLLRHVPGRLRARRSRHREERRRGRRDARRDADFTSATELCWQCKLCYIKCPYTADEGHAWMVDIPRLLMREKAQRARRNGVTLQDRVLGEPQLLGRMTAGPMARVANFVNANRLVRKAARSHGRDLGRVPASAVRRASVRDLAGAAHAARRARDRAAPSRSSRRASATTTSPRIAASAVRVLEKNGWAVVRPEQTCCGMPNLDGGDVDAARSQGEEQRRGARRRGRVRAARSSSLQPTCGYMIRKEWPELLGTPEAKEVAAATVDVMELLEQHRRDKTLVARLREGRSARSRTTPPVTSARRRSGSRPCACSARCRTPRSRSSSSARRSTARGG